MDIEIAVPTVIVDCFGNLICNAWLLMRNRSALAAHLLVLVILLMILVVVVYLKQNKKE